MSFKSRELRKTFCRFRTSARVVKIEVYMNLFFKKNTGQIRHIYFFIIYNYT